MVMVGGILLILGIALAFTNFLVDVEVPQQLLAIINRYIQDPLSFLILLNVLLLILGAMLDIFSALVIMVPLCCLWLLAMASILHFGIIFGEHADRVLYPACRNEFVHCQLPVKKPLTELYSATLPFCWCYCWR